MEIGLSFYKNHGHKYSIEVLRQIKTIPEVYINFVFWSLPGPPDPPRNCTLTNQTHDSLQVDCQEGFGSGLSQEFHMEVFTDLQVRKEFCVFFTEAHQIKFEVQIAVQI